MEINNGKTSVIVQIQENVNSKNCFYISHISPYNDTNDIVIEELDHNKKIVGKIRIPRSLLLGYAKTFIEIVNKDR